MSQKAESTEPKRSENFIQARASLPVELQPVFEQLHDEYKFAAHEVSGHPFVAPKVIAKLVIMGWRSE